MPLDLDNSYDEIKGKIDSYVTYRELKKDIENISRKGNDNSAAAKDQTVRFQSQSTTNRQDSKPATQFDQLLNILRGSLSSGNGKSDPMQMVKKLLIETAIKSKDKISTIIQEEMMKSLGCSDESEYEIANEVIVPIFTFDILKTLKNDPDGVAKSFYEDNAASTLTISPFPLNREFWRATQSTTSDYFTTNYGTPYAGYSSQGLFDLTFDPNAQLPAPFNYQTSAFRVKLSNRNRLSVSEFLSDYFKKISIFENKNLLGQIVEILTGSISIQLKQDLEEKSKLMILIERLLGLCVDNDREIDVSGIAKIPELDVIDAGFFEFDEVDLRRIDNEISNIRTGSIEFVDCGNIRFPVDSASLLDYVDGITYVSGSSETEYFDELTNTIINSHGWDQSSFPDGISITLDMELIRSLPKATVMALLSPKVLFPFVLMSLALGKTYIYNVTNISDFIRKNISLVKEIVTKVGALFLRELYAVVLKNIKLLVTTILRDLGRNSMNKRIKLILSLIELALIISTMIGDYRRCRSLVDEMLMLLSLSTKGISGGVPLPLLAFSSIRSGFDNTRAFTNVISEYQKLGLPTGPMPDGSPNLMMISKYAEIKGTQDEDTTNGKVEVFLPPNPGGMMPLKLSGVKL